MNEVAESLLQYLGSEVPCDNSLKPLNFHKFFQGASDEIKADNQALKYLNSSVLVEQQF